VVVAVNRAGVAVLTAGLLAVACDEVAKAGPGGVVQASDYLDGVERATWRDNEDTGDLDDSRVLRGETDAEGRMEIRRGQRFADGTAEGSLTWGQEGEDIVLAAWTWGDEGGTEATVLTRDGSIPGDVVDNGEGRCTVASEEGLETYYGRFDYAISSTCEGAAAPDGVYWFAQGVGLVKADTSVFFLDFVSPN
jgi:hypothetical protein